MVDRIEGRPSLKDLDGVRVAVEVASGAMFPENPAKVADALRAAIERQLRAAGIKLLAMGDFPTGDPHLRLTISAAGRGAMTAAAVQLDFVQIVFLRRNPQVTFNRAQTWKADVDLILAPAAELTDSIHREVARQVAQFIADYRAVNP